MQYNLFIIYVRGENYSSVSIALMMVRMNIKI